MQVCTLEGIDLQRSEARRQRMLELSEFIGCSTSAIESGEIAEGGVAELAKAVEERLMLLRREGLPTVCGHADMMAVMEALRAGGDLKGASRWALRAAECVRVGAGESDPMYRQLKELAGLLMASAGVDAQRYQF